MPHYFYEKDDKRRNAAREKIQELLDSFREDDRAITLDIVEALIMLLYDNEIVSFDNIKYNLNLSQYEARGNNGKG